MMAGFDQIGVRMSDRSDIAHAADTIIAAYRIRELTATIGDADAGQDVRLCEQCAIVGDYGRWLTLGIIRKTECYDASVLSHTKNVIEGALKECAKRLPLSSEEIATLGDMYYHLCSFYDERDLSNDDDAQLQPSIAAAEGRRRRSKWTAEITRKSSSGFSRLISSWLTPNA